MLAELLPAAEQIVAATDMTKEEKRIHFTSVFPWFAEKYPFLFDTCIGKTPNLKMLRFLVEKQKSIDDGVTTDDDASRAVCSHLKNLYVHDRWKIWLINHWLSMIIGEHPMTKTKGVRRRRYNNKVMEGTDKNE
jgi:hypothetical protein